MAAHTLPPSPPLSDTELHSPKDAIQHHAVAFTEARLAKPPSELLLLHDITPQLNREKRQFSQYVQIDLAHLVMLVEQGIVKPAIARQIFPVLQQIKEGGVDGIDIDPGKGTMLLQIEAALVEALGEDVAGNLHTGRSRIDQGGTARRLYKRDHLLIVMGQLVTFHKIVIATAKRFERQLIPFYTHLQQAQPGILGHYFLSFADRPHDDFERCVMAFKRANKNPLGAVGLAGTSWPIDRCRTTQLMGFDSVLDNSKLAREANYAAEIAWALSMVMSTLNDLATDLHIWCSNEFNTIRLDDSMYSTSSIFPQKKNPVALEAIRFNAGPAVNWGSTALATFRGEGTGDQALRSVPLLDGAFETTTAMLELAGGVLEGMTANEEKIDALMSVTWCTSSNLADEVVKRYGYSFRQAHHVVARLVRLCEEEHVARRDVTTQLLDKAAMQTLGKKIGMDQEGLIGALDPRAFVNSRTSQGGVSPKEIERLLKKSTQAVTEDEAWVKQKEKQLVNAAEDLQREINRILGA